MKILELLISFRPGGAERIAVELGFGLKSRGHGADIYSLIDEGFLREIAESGGIRTGSFGLRDPRFFLPALRKLEALASGYDLCVSYCTYADYALSLSKTCGPKVMTTHNIDFNRWKIPGWAHIDRWFYGRADAIVAVSQLAAEVFLEKTRIRGEKITVIRNGVDTEKFSFTERHNDPPVVIVVGRFFPVKRHDLAIRTSAELQRRGLRHKIVFAGDGPLRGAAENMAKEILPEGYYEFLGAVKDMPKVYAMADILLITSSYEGIPVSMLEAMATGLPVVSTRVGGIPEVITDGVEGFLVSPEDEGAIADRLGFLVKEEENRLRMGANARQRILQSFSLDKMTDEYISLFNKIL